MSGAWVGIAVMVVGGGLSALMALRSSWTPGQHEGREVVVPADDDRVEWLEREVRQLRGLVLSQGTEIAAASNKSDVDTEDIWLGFNLRDHRLASLERSVELLRVRALREIVGEDIEESWAPAGSPSGALTGETSRIGVWPARGA